MNCSGGLYDCWNKLKNKILGVFTWYLWNAKKLIPLLDNNGGKLLSTSTLHSYQRNRNNFCRYFNLKINIFGYVTFEESYTLDSSGNPINLFMTCLVGGLVGSTTEEEVKKFKTVKKILFKGFIWNESQLYSAYIKIRSKSRSLQWNPIAILENYDLLDTCYWFEQNMKGSNNEKLKKLKIWLCRRERLKVKKIIKGKRQ